MSRKTVPVPSRRSEWSETFWSEGHGVNAFWKRAAPIRAVDGNTVDWVLDLGFGVVVYPPLSRLNLWGVAATRRIGVDEELRAEALVEMSIVQQWLSEHTGHETTPGKWPFMIRPEKLAGGRYECIVICSDGHILNEDLVTLGLKASKPKPEREAMYRPTPPAPIATQQPQE